MYFTAVLYFFIIRPHRSIMYVDSAYSYRPSSMVCQLHSREPCKNGWTNEMPFGPRTRMDRRNHVLDGVHIPPWEGAILRGREQWRPTVKHRDTLQSSVQKWWHSAVSCAKMAELIGMPSGLWTWMGPRMHVLGGLHTGATWQIPLNRPCAVAMQPVVKLLWSLVFSFHL